MKTITCIVFLASLFLTGCEGTYFDENHLTSSDIFSYGWADMNNTDVKGNPKCLYCYRSLGQVECFKKPQPDREGQLINYYTDNAANE